MDIRSSTSPIGLRRSRLSQVRGLLPASEPRGLPIAAAYVYDIKKRTTYRVVRLTILTAESALHQSSRE